MRSFLCVFVLAGCSSDPPPAPVEIHLSTSEFELAPGEEVFKCYYTSVPSDTPLAVTRFRSSMTPGSHHMILFTTDSPSQPDGTLGACNEGGGGGVDFPVPLYLTQDPESEVAMPKGVAMTIKERQPLMFQMHYLNASSNSLRARVDLTIEHTAGTFENAAPFATFHHGISVPPHGTQTVYGACTVPDGARFFRMTTHTHKTATAARVNRSTGGQVGDVLVETQDWEHPSVSHFSDPFLRFGVNDDLYYTCSYRNDTDATIVTGQSATTNEMCMAVGYFFPATGRNVCINSLTLHF